MIHLPRHIKYAVLATVAILTGCSESSLGVKDASLATVTDTLQPARSYKCGDPLPVHYGRATFYTFADGGGNCMFDPTPNNLMVGAMNTYDYDSSYVCGSEVEIQGPNSTIMITIVDACPGCARNSIDLSPLAFAKLADTSLGNIPISWRLVPRNVSGPIVYHFMDVSNQWWTAVQIRNSRYPISTVEYRNQSGAFVSVPRTTYNYFVATSGMGIGPYTLRVTDMFGHVLVDSNLVGAAGGNYQGAAQFPACSEAIPVLLYK